VLLKVEEEEGSDSNVRPFCASARDRDTSRGWAMVPKKNEKERIKIIKKNKKNKNNNKKKEKRKGKFCGIYDTECLNHKKTAK